MGGGGTQEIRFAPYLENFHHILLDQDTNAIITAWRNATNQSPYSDYVSPNIAEGFFGVIPSTSTTYQIKDFPSLFDMFGKFLGGLDPMFLWANMYEDVIHGPEIAASVSAHAALLQDEIDTNSLPRFLAGMRDINAVQSTAFIIGKSLIARQKVASLNDFQAKIRIAALDLSKSLWVRHLDWSKEVVQVYAECMKLYYTNRQSFDANQLEYESKDKLWNLSLFDEVRAFLGALNGAPAATGKNQPSQAARSLAGTLGGAAAGAQIGGVYGAAAGAVLGLAGSFL